MLALIKLHMCHCSFCLGFSVTVVLVVLEHHVNCSTKIQASLKNLQLSIRACALWQHVVSHVSIHAVVATRGHKWCVAQFWEHAESKHGHGKFVRDEWPHSCCNVLSNRRSAQMYSTHEKPYKNVSYYKCIDNIITTTYD
jgi:hypothetical protein